jgi:hypothetical protein
LGIIIVTTAVNIAPIAVAMASEMHLSLLCLCRPSMILRDVWIRTPSTSTTTYSMHIYRPLCCMFVSQWHSAVSTILLGGFKAAQQRHSGSNCFGIYTHYSLRYSIDSIQTGSLGRPVHTCVKASHIYVCMCEYRTSGNS